MIVHLRLSLVLAARLSSIFRRRRASARRISRRLCRAVLESLLPSLHTTPTTRVSRQNRVPQICQACSKVHAHHLSYSLPLPRSSYISSSSSASAFPSSPSSPEFSHVSAMPSMAFAIAAAWALASSSSFFRLSLSSARALRRSCVYTKTSKLRETLFDSYSLKVAELMPFTNCHTWIICHS